MNKTHDIPQRHYLYHREGDGMGDRVVFCNGRLVANCFFADVASGMCAYWTAHEEDGRFVVRKKKLQGRIRVYYPVVGELIDG